MLKHQTVGYKEYFGPLQQSAAVLSNTELSTELESTNNW